ncbi:cupin domain-containing protein [bacterium]|nr:cupin domain-containing protein [bacterium]
MKVLNYREQESKQFEGDFVKGVTGRVLIGKNDGADHFCMRVFEVEEGGFSPKHSHDWEHEIFFHAGKGEVFISGEFTPVSAGSVAFIPGNLEHQIRNTGNETLVFVCLIPSGAPEI